MKTNKNPWFVFQLPGITCGWLIVRRKEPDKHFSTANMEVGAIAGNKTQAELLAEKRNKEAE